MNRVQLKNNFKIILILFIAIEQAFFTNRPQESTHFTHLHAERGMPRIVARCIAVKATATVPQSRRSCDQMRLAAHGC